MGDLDYRTTRSAKASFGMLRNGLLTAAAAAMSCWAWLNGGGVWPAVTALLCGMFLLLVIATLINSRTPLAIANGKVVVGSALKTQFPLANVSGVGRHPTRKTPSLTYADPVKGHSGEIALPWSMIAEPQCEVLARLQAAIDANRHMRS